MQFASPKEEGWRYALLLVILIAIATIATHTAINYINPLVRPREQTVVTAILCALTFGLMLISASFAVWAMRFSAESESRRRLGQMVNAMTYIRDGVLLLDRNGSITGANPTARSLFDLSHSDLSTLAELFSDLSAHDRDLLLHSDHPEEVECFGGNILPGHTLRLRSQPSRGSILLLVSDVTRLTDGRARRRRAAYLQLMGHIAQGVANDFNNLLCGIEGHASLVARAPSDVETVKRSTEAIADCANRGIKLAGRMLELSASPKSPALGTANPAASVNSGIDGIIATLPTSWNIIRSIASDIPPVNLTASQLEHIVHSLALLVADTNASELTLSILMERHNSSTLSQTNDDFAAVILLAAVSLETLETIAAEPADVPSTGLIEAVVISMLEQAGGRLDRLRASNNTSIFRICLPHAIGSDVDSEVEALPLGLEAYIRDWHVLLSQDLHNVQSLMDFLSDSGAVVNSASGLIGILSSIEEFENLAAVVIDGETLGNQDDPGILRAIIKLCPQAGLVVQQDRTPSEITQTSDVVFVSSKCTTGQLVSAMIEARSLARARRQKHASE